MPLTAEHLIEIRDSFLIAKNNIQAFAHREPLDAIDDLIDTTSEALADESSSDDDIPTQINDADGNPISLSSLLTTIKEESTAARRSVRRERRR